MGRAYGGFKRKTPGSARTGVSLRRRKPSARKVYKRLKKAPAKRKVARLAINTVAIRNLKERINKGPLQTMLQRLDTVNQVAEEGPPVVPSLFNMLPEWPIGILMNDFTNATIVDAKGGSVWYGETISDGAAPPATPQWSSAYRTMGQWKTYNPGHAQAMVADEQQWPNTNSAPVNKMGYTPIVSTVTVSVAFAVFDKAQEDYRIRLDIVKPKRIYLHTTRNGFNLPDHLGALQNMALNTFHPNKNTYNPDLWTVKSKWFVIKANRDIHRENVAKQFSFKVAFPRKELKLNRTPVLSNTTEQVWKQMDPRDQVWAIIMPDSKIVGTTTPPVIQMQRYIKWRNVQAAVAMPSGIP